MKKRIISILLVFASFIYTCFTSANADWDHSSERTFMFPNSLIEIGVEAFEGTAVKTIILPDQVMRIEKRAFSGTAFLSDVYIPAATAYIGENAFPENYTLTIHGVEGSLAEKWAQNKKVVFSNDYTTGLIESKLKQIDPQHSSEERYKLLSTLRQRLIINKKTENTERSMRQQDRPEMYPIDYRFP